MSDIEAASATTAPNRSSLSPQPTRGQGQRSRAGCRICREKKVKCDETRPFCRRCIRLNLSCDYTRVPRKKYTRRSAAANVNSFSSPTLNLPPECAIILSSFDHSAIEFFRSVLPGLVDTRPSAYSGPGMVWILAQGSPMVLHMVCALGGQKWCEKNSCPPAEADTRRYKAIEHYGEALSMLAAIVQSTVAMADFKYIFATLWLMISYELKFGDGSCIGLDAHLQGVASVLLRQPRPIRSVLNPDSAIANRFPPYHASEPEPEPEFDGLCPISCQILIWIATADAGAVLNGFGGAFSRLLGDATLGMSEVEAQARLDCLRALHQRSILVNHDVWGRSYTQAELLEDLQCSKLFCFEAESGQLRFMVGTLANAEHRDNVVYEPWRQVVAGSFHHVRSRYSEFLHIANRLELAACGAKRRFIIEIRSIVSMHHAVVLCFLRILHQDSQPTSHQREAMKDIMSLAFKVHRDQGEMGLTRLAWPLFVVAIETDDILHRSWILDRFDWLATQGENYYRASQALRMTMDPLDERNQGYFELMRQDSFPRFLL
ncbi:hypothetical protein BKA59DRAFT_425319 [Fusarium tricinctum]|uniref:Zn(2)-C6 fungal-type domain-containing protein n=1 Tax=Fusarium tricinctum TaxID=61284 RepID=A0A8K0W694_9HYPO|nr:hypothetical protein BKA59DRAFT_425319 [Fusarium tricinctum]